MYLFNNKQYIYRHKSTFMRQCAYIYISNKSSSTIGGNREMDRSYTTSQVPIQFLCPTKLLIIVINLEKIVYLAVK